jgi:Tfp pilus assembly protein FimV
MFDLIVRPIAVAACVCLGLLGAVRASAAQPAAETPAKSSYVVKAGDTLDKVVRAAFPNSPLRPDLLRDEITRLNPSAFTKGSPKVLMAGAQLQLPEHEALLSKHLGKAAAGNSTDTGADARRHWVRYP